jgi:hypothetical protein
MADESNPSDKPPVEDSSKDGQPTDKGSDGSSKPTVDLAEQARRDQQSKKDQANSHNEGLQEQIDFLSAKEAERSRDSYVSQLLTDTEKYPNVKADDPMFKFAASKEEVEEIATELQNKFTGLQQDALRSVQLESDNTLTDAQIAEQEVELEKTTKEQGKSTFTSYLSNLQRRKN